MNAQQVMAESRMVRVRELAAEVARLKTENSVLREELDALRAHFDSALLAARNLEKGGLQIWDGWNLILGAQKVARDRDELVAMAKACGERVWIVLDGHDERAVADGDVTVSYTGGTGGQRADRMICDFCRAASHLGLADRVTVRTNDKDLRKSVDRILRK